MWVFRKLEKIPGEISRSCNKSPTQMKNPLFAVTFMMNPMALLLRF
jgi:hypothetical protein